MACNCNNRNTRAWTDSNGCLRLNLNGRNFTYCPEGVSVACDPNGEGILINGQLCSFPEPGEANIVTDLEFDSDTNILTLSQENGPPVTVNLADLADDHYVESATFDSSTSELVLNRTGDLPQIRVTIPTFELPDGNENQVVSYNSDGEPIARSDIDVGYLRYTGSGTENVSSVDASETLPLGQYNFNSGFGSEVRRGHFNIVLGRYAMAGDPDVDPVLGGPSGQVIIGSVANANNNTRGDSQHGIAIGAEAEVYGGQWGIAIGSNPTSAAQSAIAIGRVAEATAPNSVAIGWQSENDVSDTVSFGNDTLKRRIRNIAAGVDPTDVVNVSQLEAATGFPVGIEYDVLRYGEDGEPEAGRIDIRHMVADGTPLTDGTALAPVFLYNNGELVVSGAYPATAVPGEASIAMYATHSTGGVYSFVLQTESIPRNLWFDATTVVGSTRQLAPVSVEMFRDAIRPLYEAIEAIDPIADPSTATVEDVATKVNEVIATLKAMLP